MLRYVEYFDVPVTLEIENGVVQRTYLNMRCGRKDPELERLLLAFSMGERNALKFYMDNLEEKFKRIYETAINISFGRVSSYGDISLACFGTKTYSRFVGITMRMNPLPIIIPCHRVIRSDGLPGGFSGSPDLKVYLLNKEGVEIREGHVGKAFFTHLETKGDHFKEVS
jgi:O-6-methylguanine DNA methyltransferase